MSRTTTVTRRTPGVASRAMALRFDAGGRPASLDEQTRSVGVVAATEAPTFVWDWDAWDTIEEVLLMSGCRMPESGRVPFLDSHSRYSVGDVIGSFRDIAVSGAELTGRCFYSATPDGETPWRKTVEGHVTDVSIGYEIHAFVTLQEGQTSVVGGREFTGPMRVVTEWSLKELSLCPIGADENAKVRQRPAPAEPRREAGEGRKETDMKKRGKTKRRGARDAEREILRLRAERDELKARLSRAKAREAQEDDDTLLPEDEPDAGIAADIPEDGEERSDTEDEQEDPKADADEDEAREDDEEKNESRSRSRRAASGDSAVKHERARIAAIRGICESFGISAEQEQRYVRKGASIDAVRKEVLDMLKGRSGGPGVTPGGHGRSALVADAERRAGTTLKR